MKSEYSLSQAELPPLSKRPQAKKRDAIRNGIICVAVFAICFWVAWPIAEISFDDDFSYIKSAQILASTGHITYNGWSGAILGWQLYAGALFIRLFGFSYTAVKLSTFPFAVGALLLFHTIQLRFGITARNAVFGTLVLGLSPLFLPLAASFMTDIPGLFSVLLCLYLCKRAIDAQTRGGTIAWLCLATAASLLGGINRQLVWLGALVMVPATGWFLRKRRGVVPAVCALWAGTLFIAFYCNNWFKAQPYSIPTPLFPATNMKPALLLIALLVALLGMFLSLILMLFPVFVVWLTRISKIGRYDLAAIGAMLTMFLVLQWAAGWHIPWADNLIVTEFSASRAADFGERSGHFMVGVPAGLIISMLVAGAFLSFLVSFQSNMQKDPPQAFLQEVLWVFVPFVLSYFAMLIPHACLGYASDRYMLVVMPFAIILMTRLQQQWIGPGIPWSGIAILTIYTLLGIAGTHDLFASFRARLAAVDEIRASGVPRTAIVAGLEYDAWTQLDVAGYMNNPRIENPPDAYRQKLPLVTVIQPAYLVTAEPPQTPVSAGFPAVHFRAWLPPFHGTFYVQKVSATDRR